MTDENRAIESQDGTANRAVPVYQEFMNPVLEALRRMGGTATNADIDAHAIQPTSAASPVAAL